MPEGTEGNVDPGNTGAQTQQIDVLKLSQDLQAAQAALAEKEKQYKGLQTTYNALHESNKALLSEKESWMEEKTTLQNQMEQFEANQGNFKAQFDELSGKYETLESENVKLKQQGKRNELITSEFPELLSFEAKGLLPEFDGDEEAFKGKLATFKETLTANATQAKQEDNSGAGPDSTDGDNSAPNRDVVLQEMMRIAGDTTKVERYRELQAKLDEIDAKAKK